MSNPHHNWRTDLGLRLGGATLCGLAWWAIHALAALHLSETRASPDVAAFVLAAAAFLFASLGAALLLLGHHIFDQVEISARWCTPAPLEDAHLPDDMTGEPDGDRLSFCLSNKDDHSAFTSIRRA